jgi:hypothetical protein
LGNLTNYFIILYISIETEAQTVNRNLGFHCFV